VRVLTIITVAACGFAGGACSSLLGLDDPTPADDGGLPTDTPPDSAPTERLEFIVGDPPIDLKIAMGQRARVHVFAVEIGGAGRREVTNEATYSSNNAAIATAAMGKIDAGTQSGPVTITASLSNALSSTVNVEVTAVQCHPVINEFQTGTAAAATDEWVEILNPCTAAIPVTGWTLVYRSAAGVTEGLMIGLTGQLAPDEIRLFAGAGYAGPQDGLLSTSVSMAQTDGGIALRSGAINDGALVDRVAYGNTTSSTHPFIEGTKMQPMANDRSAQRQPFDGRDYDDNSVDFVLATTAGKTPRAPNAK
jgi:hypothetical protein